MPKSSPIQSPFLVLPLLLAALAGCRQEPRAAENAVEAPVTELPRVARPNPPIDRAGLLAAVAQAASSAASGAALPPELRAMDGRQFEIRIRFGCRGPSNDLQQEWLGWSYDAQSRTVRVRARPTISAVEPMVARLSDQVEAVEGFWIPRPWLLQPACPATAAIDAAAAKQEPEPTDDPADKQSEPVPAAPRIGIAQFFTSTDSRTGRRDNRAYEAVHTLAEGQAIGSQGFNLVLSGRLRALPGRGVIECVASNADSPPECVVSAEFQRAWIEQPETREVIADWGDG